MAFGELDRTAAVDHGLVDTAFDGEGADEERRALDIGICVTSGCAVGELQVPALLDDAPAHQHERRRGGDRQLRVLDELVVRQRAHPANERSAGAISDQGQVTLDEHLRDELVISRGCRMPDRLDRQSTRSEPFGGPAVDPRRRGGVGRGELGLRILGKERVDAKPSASLQPGNEEVGVLELGQLGRRVRALEHGVAEICGELTQDSGALEERAPVIVEGSENLVAQIVGHEALIPSERSHGTDRVVHGPEPEPGQHESGGPPLGALDERFDLRRTQLEAPAHDEQLVRFCSGERELAQA